MSLSLLGLPAGVLEAQSPEYWDSYGFVEPYGGRRGDVTGDRGDAWKAGIRLGRVGWLAGWEVDFATERGENDEPDRFQGSASLFIKPVSSGRSALLLLVGLGASQIEPVSEESHTFLHYRYGLAYRYRFTERFGARLDLTAVRSRAGNFSSREATLGWVVYY